MECKRPQGSPGNKISDKLCLWLIPLLDEHHRNHLSPKNLGKPTEKTNGSAIAVGIFVGNIQWTWLVVNHIVLDLLKVVRKHKHIPKMMVWWWFTLAKHKNNIKIHLLQIQVAYFQNMIPEFVEYFQVGWTTRLTNNMPAPNWVIAGKPTKTLETTTYNVIQTTLPKCPFMRWAFIDFGPNSTSLIKDPWWIRKSSRPFKELSPGIVDCKPLQKQ